MSRPRTVVVELEDSTRREIPVSALGLQAQIELAAACGDRGDGSKKSFVLLQWKDGWREVVAVDQSVTELLRYYTIERAEQIGRLSLETSGSYPELLVVDRLPGRVESILLVSTDGVQTYALEEKVTIKEGGKLEHVFYDKKRPSFSKADTAEAASHYDEILKSVKGALERRGLSATSLLAKGSATRVAVYKELANEVGLKGTTRQEDVYGFLEAAVEKLAEPEGRARAATNN